MDPTTIETTSLEYAERWASLAGTIKRCPVTTPSVAAELPLASPPRGWPERAAPRARRSVPQCPITLSRSSSRVAPFLCILFGSCVPSGCSPQAVRTRHHHRSTRSGAEGRRLTSVTAQHTAADRYRPPGTVDSRHRTTARTATPRIWPGIAVQGRRRDRHWTFFCSHSWSWNCCSRTCSIYINCEAK